MYAKTKKKWKLKEGEGEIFQVKVANEYMGINSILVTMALELSSTAKRGLCQETQKVGPLKRGGANH